LSGDDEETEILTGHMLGADLGDVDARVFTTNPEEPGEGRTFVWTPTGWFERISSDETGAVEFSPLSMDEDALREWLSEQDLDITEVDDDFYDLVREEFAGESPLYLEAPELSNQE
jgi:hypothetical protein